MKCLEKVVLLGPSWPYAAALVAGGVWGRYNKVVTVMDRRLSKLWQSWSFCAKT